MSLKLEHKFQNMKKKDFRKCGQERFVFLILWYTCQNIPGFWSPLQAHLLMYMYMVAYKHSLTCFFTLLLLYCHIMLGCDRYYANLADMLGYQPSIWWKIAWLYVSPAICFGVFLYSLYEYEPLKFGLNYVYPWWGQSLGWILALSSMLCIPGYAIWKYQTTPGTFSEVCWFLWLFYPKINSRFCFAANEIDLSARHPWNRSPSSSSSFAWKRIKLRHTCLAWITIRDSRKGKKERTSW